jgi:hypothetical protein
MILSRLGIVILLSGCGGIVVGDPGGSSGSAPAAPRSPSSPNEDPVPGGGSEPIPFPPEATSLEDVDCIVGSDKYSFATKQWSTAPVSLQGGRLPLGSGALVGNHYLSCGEVPEGSLLDLDLATGQTRTFANQCSNVAVAAGRIILEERGRFRSATSFSELESGKLREESIKFAGQRSSLGGLGNALSGTWHSSNEFVHVNLSTGRSVAVRMKTHDGWMWGTSPLPGDRVAILAEGQNRNGFNLLVFDLEGNELIRVPALSSSGAGLLCYARDGAPPGTTR